MDQILKCEEATSSVSSSIDHCAHPEISSSSLSRDSKQNLKEINSPCSQEKELKIAVLGLKTPEEFESD